MLYCEAGCKRKGKCVFYEIEEGRGTKQVLITEPSRCPNRFIQREPASTHTPCWGKVLACGSFTAFPLSSPALMGVGAERSQINQFRTATQSPLWLFVTQSVPRKDVSCSWLHRFQGASRNLHTARCATAAGAEVLLQLYCSQKVAARSSFGNFDIKFHRFFQLKFRNWRGWLRFLKSTLLES